MAIPRFVVLVAGKQISVARRRAEFLDVVIELDGLLRMLPNGAMQKSRLIFKLDDGLASHGQEAMLGFPRSQSPIPILSFAQVKIVFCSKPQASSTPNASRM